MTSPPPGVVLDTNAVLDWLVFHDPAGCAIGAQIEAGALRWLATPAMRREFDHVLGRPALANWRHEARPADALWAAHAQLSEAEPPVGPLRCTDLDDQVFIDLALHQRCAGLISRDRALLALARRAAAWGVTVLTPAAWAESRPA